MNNVNTSCEELDRKLIDNWLNNLHLIKSGLKVKKEKIKEALDECSCYLDKIKNYSFLKINELIFADIRETGSKCTRLDRLFIASVDNNNVIIGIECKRFFGERKLDNIKRRIIKKLMAFYSSTMILELNENKLLCSHMKGRDILSDEILKLNKFSLIYIKPELKEVTTVETILQLVDEIWIEIERKGWADKSKIVVGYSNIEKGEWRIVNQ